MENESIKSFPLTPGRTSSVRNHLPGAIEFKIETAGGTKITVRLPPTGEVEISAGNDLLGGELNVYGVEKLGPRSID